MVVICGAGAPQHGADSGLAPLAGHDGNSLVRRIYGHLGEIRHRAAVVEYRMEQHQARVAERLEQLRASGR